MKTQVLLITKPDSERYLLVKNHLEKLDINFEICPAVFLDGEFPWVQEYDHKMRQFITGHPMTRGEVGCFLAHRKAWMRIVALNKTTLILEDDARLTPELINQFDGLSNTISNTQIIIRFFSVRHSDGKLWRKTTSGLKIFRPFIYGSTLTAYLLNKSSAEKLLAKSEKFFMAVDDYVDAEYLHSCTVLNTEPELAYNGDNGNSLIGNRHKPKVLLPTILRREIIRFFHKTLIVIHNELVLWKLRIRFAEKVKIKK